MQISLDVFSGFANSKVQRFVEREQTAFTCAFLALITQAFARNELAILTTELSTFAASNNWPKLAPDRLLNLVTLHHLQRMLIGKNVDLSSLEEVVNSLPNDILQEIVEGFLSAFQERLDTLTLTNDDITQAFDKYGIQSKTGNSKHLGDADIVRDSIDAHRMQMPRYVNCIMKQSELEEAKQKVVTYRKTQNQEKQVNFELSSCLMGYVKQIWKLSESRVTKPELIFRRLISYQEKNFKYYGRRPVGQLAIRVRDYVSIQTKSPTISAHYSDKFFQDIWKLFRDSVTSHLETHGLLDKKGRLKDDIDDYVVNEALQQHRCQAQHSVVKDLSARFSSILDPLKQWDVLVGLLDVQVENAQGLPILDYVAFLSSYEAKVWYDTKKQDNSWSIDFSSTKGYALVSQVEARDSISAAQIAYNKVRKVLTQFLFLYSHGHYSNPKPSIRNIFCVEVNTAGTHNIWLAQTKTNKAETEFLIGHPNTIAEQTETIEELSRLVDKANGNHLLAKRVTQAIYWYRKAIFADLTEDCLLYLWVSLETLVGLEEAGKVVIPYRTSLLAPVRVVADGQLTYRQLRNWTREFVEDVYHLRNAIVHGGVFEGPSFERFVDRFRATVHQAISTVLYAFILDLPTPDNLDEILAWIWDRNRDNSIALPNKEVPSD